MELWSDHFFFFKQSQWYSWWSFAHSQYLLIHSHDGGFSSLINYKNNSNKSKVNVMMSFAQNLGLKYYMFFFFQFCNPGTATLKPRPHTSSVLCVLTVVFIFRVFWCFSTTIIISKDSELDPDPETRCVWRCCFAAECRLRFEGQNFHRAEITWRNHIHLITDCAVFQALTHTQSYTCNRNQ